MAFAAFSMARFTPLKACENEHLAASLECPPVCDEPAVVLRIDIVDFSYAPQFPVVPSGVGIHWTNVDPVIHTATARSGLFDSCAMVPNDQYAFTIQSVGSQAYDCTLHAGMFGIIEIRGPGDATGDNRTDISDFAILAANFNLTDRTYVTGDFDLTGTTNISDFAILAANFNQTFLQRTSVPEPMMIASSALIPAALLRRARTSAC